MKGLWNLEPMERLNLTLGSGAVAAGFLFSTPVFASSLALGAAIEALNFRALLRGSRRLFAGDLVTGRLWLLGFGLRFLLLAVAIRWALQAGAHPIGLLLGLSSVVPAVILGAWRQRPLPLQNYEAGPAPDDPSWEQWNPWLARERTPKPEDEA